MLIVEGCLVEDVNCLRMLFEDLKCWRMFLGGCKLLEDVNYWRMLVYKDVNCCRMLIVGGC